MKKRSSFGVKLWLWFALFAAAIFAVLWLLQTVFLQRFYNDMAIRGAERALREIAARAGEADFYETIDRVAGEDALLVFVTDGAGNVLYSADEYQGLYGASGRAGRGGENPWRDPDREMNWEKGAARNLPDAYGAFTAALKSSGADSAGVVTEDNGAYVTGLVLDGGDILCLSRPLGTVGGTVEILRLQLLWVSALSLLLGFALAWAISRRFARPVTQIARSARRIAEGDYRPELPRGFCAELDELADTLEETARDLERAQNAQRELLANVSHDLRTPLTMIKGYAEMVRDISWEDAERRTDDLDIIIREADRLTALVNEILEFSSARTDSAGKKRAAFDLSRAVREVAGQFAPFRDRDGLTVETAVTDGLWVQGDEAGLKRVVYNFLDNAVHHAGESRTVRVALTGADGAARLEVTDFGPGIAPEDLPYIWDRCYTARQRKDRAVSGLGLSIAKEILLAHGAAFGVEGEGGCTFWFSLPLCPEPSCPLDEKTRGA